MNKGLLIPILLILLTSCAETQNTHTLIPAPRLIEFQTGRFYIEDFDQEYHAANTIEINDSLTKEAYILDVSKEGIRITAGSDAGKFYAQATLNLLVRQEKKGFSWPFCHIEDEPAFAVRGFMLDVGRNFQDIYTLKEILSTMGLFKLNTFHWHLTDRPAWRIESKLYPQLTAEENHRPTRDPGKFYTYDQIRELMTFARMMHIQVIPEIDMPGHSDSFTKAMGVTMDSPEGRKILRDILEEFFTEIPLELAPIIHLGSDEVRIPDPEGFIQEMTAICRAFGREVIIWNPGLPADDQVIRQTWQAQHIEKENYIEIDSWNSYINNGEPETLVSRLFFKPIGYGSENQVAGGILCLWPDVNVDRGYEAFLTNPISAALVTYAQSCWSGHQQEPPEGYLTQLPPPESDAAMQFAAFEQKLLAQQKRFFADEPFFYYPQSEQHWQIALQQKDQPVDSLEWKPATGCTLIFKDRFALGGFFQDAVPGDTAYARLVIHRDEPGPVNMLIGFETPFRANRTYGGIPQNGSWDAYGGSLFLNGLELPGPIWENPGWKPSRTDGWGSAEDQEIPWASEELYWTRDPFSIDLKEGDNLLEFRVPYHHSYQNWMVTCIVTE